MSGFYSKNIAMIREKFPRIASRLDTTDDGSIESFESKTGDPVPCFIQGEGRKLFIHSRVDPVREAERFIQEIDITGRDLIVVLGSGFGYHVEEILKKTGNENNILVIEKNPLILKKAMESRDLGILLSRDNIILAVDPDDDELTALMHGKSSKNVIFITHRGSHQVYPDYYSNILSIMKSYISTKDVNIATLAKFEKAWSSNIARNIGVIADSCGANVFYNAFKGVPAIVVAAGPSLTESIPFIKENSGRAVIVAVDTSYKILIDHGIDPHFCVTVDAQLINARYFEGSPESETVLIADPMVHPSTFRFFKGNITVTGVAFEMMKWIENICGSRGELTHGGSVSTNAYDFAKRLGASPVILVGQDLSFTKGLAHVKGSYLDEQIHNKTMRFNNAQMFNRRQLTYLPKILLPGINGGKVHSTQKMVIFINWFEKRDDPELLNATYDGAVIRGIKNIKQDAHNIPEPEENIKSMIQRLISEKTSSGPVDRKYKLKNRVESMVTEIDGLIPVLEKAVIHASELSKMIDDGRDKSDPGKVNYILGKLADTDKFIESQKNSKDMISFSIQRVIHTITEGYDIDGSSELNAGKRSEFLYRGFLEGAAFNRKILRKMVKILSEHTR
jgi:hypothetical protein